MITQGAEDLDDFRADLKLSQFVGFCFLFFVFFFQIEEPLFRLLTDSFYIGRLVLLIIDEFAQVFIGPHHHIKRLTDGQPFHQTEI